MAKPRRRRKIFSGPAFGGFFVQLEKGDVNTNEILQKAFTDGDMFTDQTPVRKYYKGEPVDVWELPRKFIGKLYEIKSAWKLDFTVYAEINCTLQLYPLLDPAMIKKAKRRKLEMRQINEWVRLKSLAKIPFKDVKSAIECIKKYYGEKYKIEEFELKAREKWPKIPEKCASNMWVIFHPKRGGACSIMRDNCNESLNLSSRAVVIFIRSGYCYCLNAYADIFITVVK